MRPYRLRHLTAVAGLAAAATLVPATGANAASSGWHNPPAVPQPAGADSSVLQDVSVHTPTDVWAVGAWWNATVHPFAVHWDGQAWAAVTTPDPARQTYFTGVSAVADDDVWIVGSGEETAGDTTPTTAVIQHFDGSAWKVVPSPAAPAGTESDLDDVDMRTSGDGWAVGHLTTRDQTQPLILRWQAGQWTQSRLPDLPGAELTSVSANSAGDVWAAGTATDTAGATAAVLLHFDGVSWSRVDVPVPAGSSLSSVSTTRAGDVWAGGSTCAGATCVPLLLHRTASGWGTERAVAGAVVTEIVALSTADVWTIGYSRGPTGVRAAHVEHWTGSGFQADVVLLPAGVATPNNDIASATPLAGAAGDPASGVLWAVGWAAGPPRSPNVVYRD